MIRKISEKHTEEFCAGNKGKFLNFMNQNGFAVPDGVILDSSEYLYFIRQNKLEDRINSLLKELNSDNVGEISEQLISLFSDAVLSEKVREILDKSLDKEGFYAVRSSGTKEDLDDYSFAGQYQTFLNVQGLDEIEKNIIACYQSMFSETILSYLVNQNIDLNDLAMAVVVQEMVQADYSGICFTINPVSGNDKEMLIEVAEGLGENIVSGKVKPEQYYYNWYECEGTYDNNNKILDKEKLGEIAETFFDIQTLFGYPCDIEFAIKNGKLYILQARKITKINYAMLDDIWSTADFKDGGVSATVCTPYMWSLYEYIWEFTLRKFMIDSDILKEKEVNRKLGDMFYGRCYWNVCMVKLAMSKVIGYKEREFDSEYGVRITYDGDGETTKITPASLIAIIRMYFGQQRILKERNENAENYKADLLNKYNDYRSKYDNNQIDDIEKVWYTLTKKTYLQSEATYFWQIFINTIHQSLYKDGLLKYVSESEYLTLLGSIDDISHLLPFYEMWDISREIRKDEENCEFWTKSSIDDIKNALNDTKYCMPKVKELIEAYGYHSDKELDVTYPCYYEDVAPLLISVKDMVALGDEFSPQQDRERGRNQYKEILERIEKQVGSKKYKKIDTKIRNMRKMLWWREEFRDISTRFYYIIRIYTMELAKHFVKKNIIDEMDDIWFLKVGSIWDFLDEKISIEDIRVQIRKNKRYYNAYRNYMSENEIGGVFGETGNDSFSGKNNLIKGLGANNGVITGTARVIEDFSEIHRLQENDILVTRFTDTGWTSKFAILSGIVTEYGGILCHAAIVSREYGIPAIVSCHDVMSKIKDGQTITIDGATGIVKIEN